MFYSLELPAHSSIGVMDLRVRSDLHPAPAPDELHGPGELSLNFKHFLYNEGNACC